MEPRIALNKLGPKPIQLLQQLEAYLHDSGLDPKLDNLIKLRVSQMNGCAYCIDMHWKDLRAGGETEQRLYGLDAWEESPYYTPKERAALTWAEAVTTLEDHVPEAVFRSVKEHFDDKAMADLTLAIAMINVWNRLCIPLRVPAGTYQVRK